MQGTKIFKKIKTKKMSKKNNHSPDPVGNTATIVFKAINGGINFVERLPRNLSLAEKNIYKLGSKVKRVLLGFHNHNKSDLTLTIFYTIAMVLMVLIMIIPAMILILRAFSGAK